MSVTGIGEVANFASMLVGRLFPDEKDQKKHHEAIARMASTGELDLIAKRAAIIQSETKSKNIIERTWRPITMLVFVFLIVSHWFGFTENVTDAEVDELLEIIKFGLTGFLIGQSAERVAEHLSKKKKNE